MSTKEKGDRGAGRIYQRGNIWWIQYCYRGKVYRESSNSDDDRAATRLLRKRLGEKEAGTFKGPKVEKTTFEDMAQDVLNDYRINDRKSFAKVSQTISRLKEVFGMDRMIDITTDRIKAYAVKRQENEVTNGTI